MAKPDRPGPGPSRTDGGRGAKGAAAADWTEKYRPRSLDELVGHPTAVKELRGWAREWQRGRPSRVALLMAGPPGIGKTSAALALAQEVGWAVVELNASDARNYDAIRAIAYAGALSQSFGSDGSFDPGARKLILIDEADSLHERAASGESGDDLGDAGGRRAIIEVLRNTQQPIILLVNDAYSLTGGRGAAIKSLVETLRLRPLSVTAVKQRLSQIARAEGLHADDDALAALAERSQGDLRSAINDLQSLAIGEERVRLGDIEALGSRDRTLEMRQALKEVFRGSSGWKAQQALQAVDEAPDSAILWIDENIPLFYRAPQELVDGYEALSRADVFLGRVRRRQYYGLWRYATDLMGPGVFAARQRTYRDSATASFPQFLLKMGRSRATRQTRSDLLGKVGSYTHCSRDQAQELVPALRSLFDHDMSLASRLGRRLELSEDEVVLLVGPEVGQRVLDALRSDEDHQVAVDSAQARAEEGGDGDEDPTPVEGQDQDAPEVAPPEQSRKASQGSESSPGPPLGQKSLFEF